MIQSQALCTGNDHNIPVRQPTSRKLSTGKQNTAQHWLAGGYRTSMTLAGPCSILYKEKLSHNVCKSRPQSHRGL